MKKCLMKSLNAQFESSIDNIHALAKTVTCTLEQTKDAVDQLVNEVRQEQRPASLAAGALNPATVVVTFQPQLTR